MVASNNMWSKIRLAPDFTHTCSLSSVSSVMCDSNARGSASLFISIKTITEHLNIIKNEVSVITFQFK